MATQHIEETDQPRKYLFCASTGGHITELMRLSERMNVREDSLWVTFDDEQTRTVLEGRRHEFVPFVSQRDWRGTMRVIPHIRRILRRETFDHAASNGAAIAAAVLPMARMHGVPATYVETIGRLDGPSMTGRLLQRAPGVELRTQHESWAHGRWQAYPSVLETFVGVRKPTVARPRMFVTLGTMTYRFDSLVDAILATGLADESTVWQVGGTMRDDLPGTVQAAMGPDEWVDAVSSADVVVSHCGVGSLYQYLELGKLPVMGIRRAARNEHVDDHQIEIGRYAAERGLAIVTEAPDLTAEHIRDASGWRVLDSADPGIRAAS
ncbi:glycosyltransferase [Demequina maris]|uniref:glycosyltransferase n=1 Tax=Demequina maris TaxID=1638982 RepID=UPI0007818B0B|nr:glycosyltransferase [Demequina maris]